jgi:dTDP-4-dehydrorhamnose reductase
MKNKRSVLVTGIQGFIGSRFRERSNHIFSLEDIRRNDLIGTFGLTTHTYICDVLKGDQMERIVASSHADTVLHLVAKTHIDRCETDRRKGRDGEAWKVNVEGSRTIARICAKHNKFLLYLSTECVFDGKSTSYNEDDVPNPINWYGETKYRGEEEVLASGAESCILRSVLAYGHTDQYPIDIFNNFIHYFRANTPFKAVTDQRVGFTFIDDLIDVIIKIIQTRTVGKFHYAGTSPYSPYEFAKLMCDILHYPIGLVEPTTMNQYFGDKARLRLRNAVLSSDKILRTLGVKPSSLKSVLLQFKKKQNTSL